MIKESELGKSADISIIDFYNVESTEASEFRRLMHNINGSSAGGDKKAILVTSAMVSEGKSLVSSFLAMTAVRHKNKKTLLIDFDLRRPTIHRLFNLPREKGLTEILSEGLSSRSAIKTTSIEKLDIITAGKAIPNPSDLINGPMIHKIVEEMKFYYELILIDSSPVVPVSDPILVMEEVDGVILVVKAGATPKGIISRACDLLSPQRNKILGVVVNNLTHTLPYYYNQRYYGYQYKPTKK
jgi:capsular exopolysaccharide synthesis family protein